MYKSEAASWFRIYEMFEFGSFHMYGIIGSALFLGIIGIQFLKRIKASAWNKQPLQLEPKNRGFYRYMLGGILFGLGWALAGACPGPMYVLLGAGFWSILIVIGSAVLGTFCYGIIKNRLPH
jgi:uncharacterized membrane protein YedE/YeeE